MHDKYKKTTAELLAQLAMIKAREVSFETKKPGKRARHKHLARLRGSQTPR
jgi:hypothetical protein